jgi:hypothetical protein
VGRRRVEERRDDLHYEWKTPTRGICGDERDTNFERAREEGMMANSCRMWINFIEFFLTDVQGGYMGVLQLLSNYLDNNAALKRS